MDLILSGIVLPLLWWELSSAQVVYSVSEEVREGTVVGNVAKDLHLTPQDLEARRFEVVSGQEYFGVSLKTGALFVSGRIDREALCSKAQKCSMRVEAMAQNPLVLYRIEVNVVDINDNAPLFTTGRHILNITELSAVGERFTLPAAEDPDTGSNAVKSYKLSPNDHFALEVQAGEDSVSVEMVLKKVLDRETQPVINLILTALDGGRPPLSGTLEIVVSVLDVNDNPPVFSQSLYKVKMMENAAPGARVLSLSATDLDEGPNGEIVYALVRQSSAKNSELFSINPQSGVITVKGELDYEVDAAVELRVEAKDKGQPPKSSQCKVLVEIVDINDNPPEIVVTSLSGSVKEDCREGTAVALFTVSDKDGGKNGVVHCSIVGLVPFKIESSYKNYYSLVVNGPLDREDVAVYHIAVKATDEGTPSLSSTSVLTVHIADVNDNMPLFPEPFMNVYVKENSPAGVVIGNVRAQDKDVSENAQISYALIGGLPFIDINSETGDIYSKQSFNYEELKRLQFQVQATDSGSPPLSSNVSVSVFVLDENDNSPVLLAPYSEAGSVSTESVPYSAEAGYFVAKVRAVDADCGYNALLSYHLTEAKGTNLFRIGSSSGEIRTKRRMSDNDLKSHALVVTVSDHGEPSLSATASVEVVVVESVERVQPSLRQVPLKEEAFSDLNLYLLIAIVSVSGLFLLSLVALAAARCCGSGGALGSCGAPVVTAHPDGSWSYSKATQQYDVCFSSDTLKSDVVVFPSPFPPPADAELISINGGDTFTRGHTLTSAGKM
ncbi:protocadherin alpha-2-like [Hoplias malabaricus]|uniref:protocadherin alpha-2-like n=1 Tax=Hoplias malabaricus TaxID=27720 RepID=UPI0034631F7D